ncbi:MAG: GNAT family N-acetyltransferase [Propionibacteriaceae bacterium]|nr:GNAT family N-acetyltransferase [Propionibacteriaceae bacterium]
MNRRRTGVRTLDTRDLDAVWDTLARDPVANVFVAARVQTFGLEPWRLGCPVYGYFDAGELAALCHQGANLVPVAADEDALDGFVQVLSGTRRCSSIVGPAEQALGLWNRLADHWGGPWSTIREVRPSQPMMSISAAPAVEPHPCVQRIGAEHADAYFDAAVRMYTEEVGVSPIVGGDPGPYRSYVDHVIGKGRAFGIIRHGQVVYKSDIGSAAQGVGQIQGVWLDPSYRGQGAAAAAMAGVVELARAEFDTLSLYVNSFNTPARATYRRVGFAEVGEFATILY